jgi:hypothetical protein
MKLRFDFAERAITCGLLGAITIAVASGMHRVQVDTDSAADPNSPQRARAVIQEFVFEERLDGELANTEQRLAKLVESVERATDADKDAKKSELKQALTEIFRQRTEAQRKRIAEMKDRLNKIESQLDRRVELQEQIVQRRLGELLGEKDELSWEPASDFDTGILEVRRPLDDWSGKLGLPSATGTESPAEYPFEFPVPAAAALRDRTTPRSRKGAEQVEKAANDAKRAAEQIRSLHVLPHDTKMLMDKQSRDPVQLGALENLRGSLVLQERLLSELQEKKKMGLGAQTEERLKALQAQFEILQKQLEAVRPALEAAETRAK